MGEGREIKLHPCRRKPRGVFVGRDGGEWALVKQETPLSSPRRAGDGSLEVTFAGSLLVDGISYCPYCGGLLPEPSGPAGCYVLHGAMAERVADGPDDCWETLSEGGGE